MSLPRKYKNIVREESKISSRCGGGIIYEATHKVKAEVMLIPTVSLSACLGVKHPSWAQDQIFITVTQLWVCYMGRPLWRKDGSAVLYYCWSSPAPSNLPPMNSSCHLVS
jgi:hypothetical protein